MIPIRDNTIARGRPVVTWTIIGLNVLIYLWDRHGHITGPSVTFADLTLRPYDVVMSIEGHEPKFALVTILTSMFMHANLLHIVGNMLFLLVFGPAIEQALRSPRYALYYLAWGVVAAGAHIFVYPHSEVPVLGASGAIGGVLGAYLLLFPGNKVEIFVPLLAFLTFEVSAWVLLGLWFVYQIAAPQQGVANWAHIGGFLAGMLTVLVMGGRAAVLKGREEEFEHDL
ncbi:MAG TPA: rhomboid family intramembrane serine protease [Fimbriimonadaceae bacterium]|nr:rhomboid family intramembrane serine protease [Fimbriimonadaceae bacterium]